MAYELEEYFCIFIDILGYTKRMENSAKKNELENELKDYIDNVVDEIEYLNELSSIIPFQINIFTDNILITLPAKKETINNFHLVLRFIIDYQTTLILRNYFIRGGITKGKMFVNKDKDTIWGPALIEAVQIEKSTKYPFIGISDKILKLFRINDLLSDTNDLLNIPFIEIEGRNVLDYLGHRIIFKNNDTIPQYSDFLDFHKKIVDCSLKKYKNDENILNKYLSLAKYHNEFCNLHKDKLPPIQDLLINYYPNTDVSYKRKYLRMKLDN
jgi:hypothetical protein